MLSEADLAARRAAAEKIRAVSNLQDEIIDWASNDDHTGNAAIKSRAVDILFKICLVFNRAFDLQSFKKIELVFTALSSFVEQANEDESMIKRNNFLIFLTHLIQKIEKPNNTAGSIFDDRLLHFAFEPKHIEQHKRKFPLHQPIFDGHEFVMALPEGLCKLPLLTIDTYEQEMHLELRPRFLKRIHEADSDTFTYKNTFMSKSDRDFFIRKLIEHNFIQEAQVELID